MTLRFRSLVWLAVSRGPCRLAARSRRPLPHRWWLRPHRHAWSRHRRRHRSPPAPVDNSAENARIAAAITAAKNTITQTIYFDYDKDVIRDDARAVLDAKVPVLQANPSVRIRIAGHTDERGSERIQHGARPEARRGGVALPAGARHRASRASTS